MIVVDTNVVSYALLEGPRTALARRVWDLDPGWRVPELCPHECLNVIATYARRAPLAWEQVRGLWMHAADILRDCVYPVDLSAALKLAVERGVTAYDAQFVALSRSLGVPCVTEDRELLRKFPETTVSMEAFCRR